MQSAVPPVNVKGTVWVNGTAVTVRSSPLGSIVLAGVDLKLNAPKLNTVVWPAVVCSGPIVIVVCGVNVQLKMSWLAVASPVPPVNPTNAFPLFKPRLLRLAETPPRNTSFPSTLTSKKLSKHSEQDGGS